MQYFIELLPYFLFAIIGSTLHILKKFAQLEEGKRRFNPKTWLKKHKWTTILGFCLSLGGVVLLQELDQLSYAAVLMSGYVGDSLMKMKDKDKAVG